MIKAEQTVVIDRPIEEVFAYCRSDEHAQLASRSGGGEANDGQPDWGGHEAHMFVRNFMGGGWRRTTSTWRTSPIGSCTFRTTSGPPFVASYLFDPVLDGTHLTSRVELHGAGLFGLLEPVIGAGLRREMKAALPALKALLEGQSATTSPRPTAT